MGIDSDGNKLMGNDRIIINADVNHFGESWFEQEMIRMGTDLVGNDSDGNCSGGNWFIWELNG